tara:strand:+ start:495 stop:2636 length:2142 start_codon:yes stop_codon:yes gene_type:complete
MAKEVLELEVKTNVSGAKQEMDKLGSSVNNAETELKELNEQLEIQVEVVNKLETALLEMKQQQSVNSDYENSVSRLNERIKETTMELALEKQGLKTLKRERSVTIKNVKDLEKAQKAQIKQAFAGIKHFNIMGVSLRRLRLMTRAVIPGFKLMFKTIKTGIASTGIGLIVIALASIGTALARTGKGAKAFKAILAGLREVVNFLLKPLELAGDALLSLFGVDDAPAVDVVAQMKSEIESLNNSLGDIELQQIKNKAANRENQKIVDDVTKSEEERLAALEKIFNTNKSTQQQTLANLERQVVLQTEVARKAKSAHDWHKQGGAAQETINKLKKEQVNEENNLIALQKKLANLKDEMLVAEDDFEKNIAEVKSFNINQEKEREKELAAQRKKFREQRENGEKKIAAIILKLQQEAAIEELATDEEKEKKKLEFKMEKQKEDILNSKASQKSKDAALLLLEEDFQNDLQEITDKFDDKNQKKLDKEAEDLKKIRNQNLLAEEEDETKRQLMLLEIQKQAELDKLAEHENFAELKLAIDEKYQGKVKKIEEKSAKDQQKLDDDIQKGKIAIAMKGLSLVEQAAGEGSKVAKAAALAQATISGTQSVLEAFKSGVANTPMMTATGGTFGIIQASLAAGFAALQIRKIAAGQGPEGNGGGGGGGMSEVADTTPATQMLSGSFSLGQGVAPEPVKAFVVTDEMTNSQNQLANIRRRSTI